MRSGILPEESYAAISVAGSVQVKRIPAIGLALEVKAISWALREASRSGPGPVELGVPQLFHDQVVGSAPVVPGDERILQNVRQMLLHNPVEVFVADPDPALCALVASQPLFENGWTLAEDDAQWVAEHGATVVFTDGSCSPRMLGAWAWYVDAERFASGPVETVASPLTAERRAVYEALTAVPGPVLVLCDHESVMDSFDAVLDAMSVPDPLTGLVRTMPVRVSHVKGHADCLGNLRADRLASRALSARSAELEADPDLGILHDATVAEVTDRLWDRQEARRIQARWCATRRRELISERYPLFDSMSQPDRKRLGGEVHLQALREYAQLQQLV